MSFLLPFLGNIGRTILPGLLTMGAKKLASSRIGQKVLGNDLVR
jgi:hypothetical protein